MRQRYEMTDAQMQKILDASKPVPYIMLQCGEPRSPYDKAMDAWRLLGAELGFKWDTVRPTGEGDRFFTAEVDTLAERIQRAQSILPGDGGKGECL